jgi:hypothetical protein
MRRALRVLDLTAWVYAALYVNPISIILGH